MQKNVPIPTLHLFAPLHEQLIQLLRGLSPEEWVLPTVAKQWKVKDVVAHLLDTSIRYVSANRDHHFLRPATSIASHEDLATWLNALNAEWVMSMKRVSSPILVDWLDAAGRQQNELLLLADEFAMAPFGVSWAGEEHSVNWFHIAREYTERWHHQQQVRDAVSKPGILTNEFYYPVLDTFMMALPFNYRNTHAEAGTVLQVSITGDGGGEWFLEKGVQWVLDKKNSSPVNTKISIDGNIAWKLFTKSWRKENSMNHIIIEGNPSLAEPVLDMVTVVA